MAPGYGIDSIGFDSLYRYYPSFYGTDSTQQAQYAQLLKQYEQAAASSPTDSATQAMTFQGDVSPRYKKEEDHTLRNVGIAVGAAALIYAAYRGGGNPLTGAKDIWSKNIVPAWNKLWGKASSATEGVTKELKAVVKDGKVKLLVPGETESFVAANSDNIAGKAAEYGIDIKKLMSTTKGNIKSLNGGEFILDDCVVKFSGNKILSVEQVLQDGSRKNLTTDVVNKLGADGTALRAKIDDFIANARKLEKGWGKGFLSTDITTQVGDNVLQVTRQAKNARIAKSGGGTWFWETIKPTTKVEPEITKLTTLKRFDPTDPKVLAYVSDKEALKKLIESDSFKAGKLFTGSNAGVVEIKSNTGALSGKTFRFNNGELVGYTEGGKFYSTTSPEFKTFKGTGSNYNDAMNLYSANLNAKNPMNDGRIEYGVFSLG